MPHFSITGMASTSIREAKDRLRSAIEHSGYKFPMTRKIIHLAPAEHPKQGSHFDLAMAIGLLAASGQVSLPDSDILLIGELGLEGGVRGVRGLLPGLVQAKNKGITRVILPHANYAEAQLLEGMTLFPVKSLQEAITALGSPLPTFEPHHPLTQTKYPWTLDDIHGHEPAKRALVIAAAGGHHLLMQGPPGTGKSLLARAFPSLLPPLSNEALLEVRQIYSISGVELKYPRPFRKVHHSTSRAQLLGGGQQGHPGELSLSHHGVLYLDELPEFRREVIESLRQPLEEGRYTLMRRQYNFEYPCHFQLIASMNPCPCAYFGDPQHACTCHPYEIARYQKKLSGPFLDRLDLFIDVPRLNFHELTTSPSSTFKRLQEQVNLAQQIQFERQGKLNQDLSGSELAHLSLSEPIREQLKIASERMGLSSRSIHKILKITLTLADLNTRVPCEADLHEAMSYRK